MTLGGPATAQPWAAEPALRCGPTTATWADVLAEARRTGLWGDLEADVAAREAAVAAAAPPAQALTDAAVADRRARRLIAADDLRAWLAAWGLNQEDWLGHLRRALVAPAEAERPADASAVWATAVCGGTATAAARRLAEGLAAAAALGLDPGPAGRDLARDRLVAEAAGDAAVTSSLRARGTGATRFRWRRAVLADADAAREAVLCLREDGLTLDQLGLAPTRHESLLDAAPAGLRTALLAARPGAVVHPVPGDDPGALLVVDERTAPDPADAALRAEARDRLGAAALRNEVAARVAPLGPLAAERSW